MESIPDINMQPALKNRAVTARMILGPILSFNCPIKMAKKPETRKAVDDAPEIAARGHPNSDINGVKNTPKAINIPTPTDCRQKQQVIIILE